MTRHTAFQIKLGLLAMDAARSGDPSRAEMIGGKDVHRAVTFIAIAQLVMADATTHLGKVRVEAVSGKIISRMRTGNFIAVVTSLTILPQTVAKHTCVLRCRCSRTMQTQPVQFVVGRLQIVGRQMTHGALVRHATLLVTIHALRHIGQMSCLVRRQRISDWCSTWSLDYRRY